MSLESIVTVNPVVRKYTVEEWPHGRVIRGGLPVSEMGALFKVFNEEQGYNLLDSGIGTTLGRNVFVLVSEESGRAWRAEIEAENLKRFPDHPLKRWLYGVDTGTSSLTIASVLDAETFSKVRLSVATGKDGCAGFPHDPDDFGRCYRLLEIMPEWRARLSEVAAQCPDWAPLIAAWAELEDLWREETAAGKDCPKLFARMKDLTRPARSKTLLAEQEDVEIHGIVDPGA